MLLFVCFPSFFHHHLSSMSVLSNRIAITGCCADGGAPWRARENESWPTFWQWRQKSEELSCASLIFSSVIFFFSSSYPSVSDISLVSSRSPPTGSPLFFRVSRVSASLTWPGHRPQNPQPDGEVEQGCLKVNVNVKGCFKPGVKHTVCGPKPGR